MKVEDLVNAGYRKYEDYYHKVTYGYAFKGLYQKRFDDDVGKKYFIDIVVLSYEMHGQPYTGFKTTSQFNSDETHNETFNVEYIVNQEDSIEKVEEFFDKMWSKLNLAYYEKFEIAPTQESIENDKAICKI